MWDGGQPYLRASASRKALLCKVKPNSVSGRDVNQLEAPFSVTRSTALRRVSSSIGFMAEASDCSVRRFYLWMAFLMESCLSQHSEGYEGLCKRMRSLSGSNARSQERNCRSATLVGLKRAMPPSLSGSAKRSRSRSPGGALPVRVGSSSVLIVVSRGSRRELMVGVVRAR